MTAAQKIEELQAARREEQEMLLNEVHHRVANSLQIIASILLLKARTVESTETRQHLHDVHHRLISAGHRAAPIERFKAGQRRRTRSLPESPVRGSGGSRWSRISRELRSRRPRRARYDQVRGFRWLRRLIVTELVINSLKHGFPNERNGHIEVDFVRDGDDWRLSVLDNGVGRPASPAIRVRPGLGTSIVEALARNLGARVEIGLPGQGAITSVVHPA